MDDITISQSAIVQQLRVANPKLKTGELYKKAMAVGKDHIASMINTLVLVYTGASMPLLLLFMNNPRPFDEILNFEFSGTVHMISSWVEQKIFSVKIEPFYQCSGKILTGEDEIREYFMDLFSDAIEHDEDLAPFIDDLYKKEVKPAICIYTLLQGRVND